MPNNNNDFFTPHKLKAIRKQLESRLERRKKARELLLPQEKSNFIDKIKNAFNT